MKRLLLLTVIIISCFQTVNAQEKNHQHTGFFLSMSAGPVFGNITDDVTGDVNGDYSMDMSGGGAVFDLKIGGAIQENLIVHATLISQTMAGPTIKMSNNQNSVKATDEITIGEAMFGGGLTYYIMPQNIFFSGSLGLGNFTIMDQKNEQTTSTQRGFSMQLKAGKEWWVSKKWGLGISVTYGKTSLTNKSGGLVEKLDSNRFGILFNATLN